MIIINTTWHLKPVDFACVCVCVCTSKEAAVTVDRPVNVLAVNVVTSWSELSNYCELL